MVRDARALKYSCIGLLIVSLLVIGYAGIHDGSASARSAVRYAGDDPRILVHDFPIAMQALITGVLAYRQADGCLVLKGRYGGKEQIPVWREGVAPVLEHGRRGVRLADGALLLEGDKFTASGGEVTLEAKPFYGFSSRCAGIFEPVVVLNSDVVPSGIY